MTRTISMRAMPQSRPAPGTKGRMMTVRVLPSILGAAAVLALPAAAPAAPAHTAKHHAAKVAKTAKPAPLPVRHIGVMPAMPAGTPGVTAPARTLTIGIGRGELVTLPGFMSDVFVASETVADVQVKSGNQLFVFGKAPGETTVYASNARGDVVWSANVRVGANIDSIDQMLHLALPDAHILSTTLNNTVLLTGTVAAPEDAAEAERLVKGFVSKETTVISRLKMATPLQVSLQVRIAEVSRSLARDISSNIASASTNSSGFKYGIGQGANWYNNGYSSLPLGVGTQVQGYVQNPLNVTPTNPLGLTPATGIGINAATIGSTIGLAGKFAGLNLLAALNLGEQIGLVTTLAEPNLTALSGETAEFLAGGEFPIPLSSGLGTVSIDYKKYGVSLAYTPTVLANGRISLRVRPEVSELTSEGSVSLNGYAIPGLTVRRAETTVELGSGQSFMIAGLLKNDSQNTITKLPGAGDLPVLGSLFRSTAYKRGETELVIVVTPYLVNPVDANQIHLPTDGYKAATAVQQLLGNLESDNPKGTVGPKPVEHPATQQSGPSGAPAPAVGAADPAIKGKATASADAQPGFSIQ